MSVLNKYTNDENNVTCDTIPALDTYHSQVAIESMIDAVDTMSEIKVSAEQLKEALFGLENINDDSKIFINNYFESLKKRAGYSGNISLESVDGEDFLTVSQEGIVEFIKKVWMAIVNAVKKVFSMIKEFFKNIFSFLFNGRKRVKENNELIEEAEKVKKDALKASKDLNDAIFNLSKLEKERKENKKILDEMEKQLDELLLNSDVISVINQQTGTTIETEKVGPNLYSVKKDVVDKIKDAKLKTQCPNILAQMGKKPGEAVNYIDINLTLLYNIAGDFLKNSTLVKKSGFEIFKLAEDVVKSGYDENKTEKLEDAWNSMVDDLKLEKGVNFGNMHFRASDIPSNLKPGALRTKKISVGDRVMNPSDAIIPLPEPRDLEQWSGGIEKTLSMAEKDLKGMEKEYNIFSSAFENLDKEIMKTAAGHKLDERAAANEEEQIIKNRINSLYDLLSDLVMFNNKVTHAGFGLYKELTQLGVEISTYTAKLVK